METQETPQTRAAASSYINNPFTIAVEGIKVLFKKATTISIVLVVLSALSATNYINNRSDAQPSHDGRAFVMPQFDPAAVLVVGAIIAVMLFAMLMFSSIVTGFCAYTAAELAKGRSVSFKQAAKAVFDQLWQFVWLQIIKGVKVLLWSLLFIIPGIVMAIRYCLADVAFFDSDKKLRGNAAIKESLSLTKGAWITTFGAQVLFNIVTLGLISPIVDVAAKTMLYRQLTELEAQDGVKPRPHGLSWLAFGLFLFFALVVVAVCIIIGIELTHLSNDLHLSSPLELTHMI